MGIQPLPMMEAWMTSKNPRNTPLQTKSHISPSAIKGSPQEHCLIPAIFRRGSPERFGPTPSTFLGTLFHELIEDAGSGTDPKVQIKKLKKMKLKDVSIQRLFAAGDSRGFKMRKKPFLALAQEAFAAYQASGSTKPTAPASDSNSNTKTIPYANYAAPLSNGIYYEQAMAFQFEGVWLYGIIDHLKVTPTEVIITDFKTGKMMDYEGKTKEGYTIQMLVYGYMASKIYRNRTITLQLKGASPNGSPQTIPVPFTSASARKLIKPIVSAYQQYQSTPKYRPGKDCRWCSLRVDCPDYHTEVESKKWWLLGSNEEFAIPFDIWGVITSKEPSGRDGFCNLTIKTNVGLFDVTYIPEEDVRNKQVGSFIEIYSMFNPNGTQFSKHLPRNLTIGPLSAARAPWNQSFSYIIV